MEVLLHKGMYLPNICLLCYGDGESIDHILIHCPFTVDIWNAMLQGFNMRWVFPRQVNSLLSGWRTSAFNAKGKRIWGMVPTVVRHLLHLQIKEPMMIKPRKKHTTYLWRPAPHDGPGILRPPPQLNGVEFFKRGRVDAVTLSWLEKFQLL